MTMKHFLDKLNLDALGFSASTICAIHCLALPFAASVLPMLGLNFLANPAFEFSIITFGAIVGVTSLSHGYLKHHRTLTPILILVSGFTLIGLGHLLFEEYEFLFTSSGATLVAISHLVNMRLMKHAKECAH
jgi:hypothetical protein